jgi:hypothetical protein
LPHISAIVIEKLPGPIGPPGSAGNEQDDPVRANAHLAMAKAGDLVGVQLDFLGAIIYKHKVITGTIHLGEFQNHAVKLAGGG